MQPRFPVLRSLVTALVLAAVVAAAVAVVARLTLPDYRDPAGAAPVAVLGALAMPDQAPADQPGDAGAGGEGTGETGAAADAGDSETAPAPGDSASAAGDTASAAPVVTDVAAAGSVDRAPSTVRSRLAAIMDEVTSAPERWLVLTAFGATFIAALLTALFAVRGSGPREVEAGPVRRRSDAVQLLAVLQREGRLVDFLREEIEPFTDAQIGAAVRAVHAGCRKALDDHMVLGPVRDDQEGADVTVAEGFDPSATRLTGNVSGEPPFQGTVRHRGWRATELDLPTDARGQDPEIVAPAEVEIP